MHTYFSHEIPVESRVEFLSAINRINRQKAESFALVIAAVNLVLLFALDLPRYTAGAWELNAFYAYAFLMHGFAVPAHLGYYVLSRSFRDPEKDMMFFIAFCVITLLWCAYFALLAQLVRGDVVIYIMGLFGVSVAFYFTPFVRTVLLVAIQAFFLAGLQFFLPEEQLTVGIYINTSISVILCWLISRSYLSSKVTDFRQLKQIQAKQAEILELNRSLLEADEEKNEFLGIAAHDLKNPLSGIMLTAELVRSYSDSMTPAEISRHMDTIDTTARRMSGIIVNLLDISALDSGDYRLGHEEIRLREVMVPILGAHAEAARKKLIEIIPEFPPELTLITDRQALSSVIENLLSNAVKFSAPGTTVTLRAMQQGDHSIELQVEDQGPGLTEQDRNNLFRRFSKLSARPSGGEQSTGLGLSIVKKLVDLMGGTVKVSGEAGKGACFTVILPIAPPAYTAPGSAPAENPVGQTV